MSPHTPINTTPRAEESSGSVTDRDAMNRSLVAADLRRRYPNLFEPMPEVTSSMSLTYNTPSSTSIVSPSFSPTRQSPTKLYIRNGPSSPKIAELEDLEKEVPQDRRDPPSGTSTPEEEPIGPPSELQKRYPTIFAPPSLMGFGKKAKSARDEGITFRPTIWRDFIGEREVASRREEIPSTVSTGSTGSPSKSMSTRWQDLISDPHEPTTVVESTASQEIGNPNVSAKPDVPAPIGTSSAESEQRPSEEEPGMTGYRIRYRARFSKPGLRPTSLETRDGRYRLTVGAYRSGTAFHPRPLYYIR